MFTEQQDILDSAADLFEEEGWIQHHLKTNDGRCSVGGIEEASIDQPRDVFFCAKELLRDKLVKIGAGNDILAWNDKPGQKVEEILRVFRTPLEEL
jgi:hypothetical protein